MWQFIQEIEDTQSAIIVNRMSDSFLMMKKIPNLKVRGDGFNQAKLDSLWSQKTF